MLIPSKTCNFLFFRQTQLLESHVSGHMVKKEITQEGEVSGATIQNNDAEINHCLLSDCLL